MKAYHGSSHEINLMEDNPIYFSLNLKDALEYALGLNDLGEYNSESFIYEIEIPDELIRIENDFMYFDIRGYNDIKGDWDILLNKESSWICVKNPTLFPFKLIENYKNNL
jgi:hypothetical protein